MLDQLGIAFLQLRSIPPTSDEILLSLRSTFDRRESRHTFPSLIALARERDYKWWAPKSSWARNP